MDSVNINGKQCFIGDVVCFKSDVEQCGRIKQIKQSRYGNFMLLLTSEYGFQGDYIGGDLETLVDAADCWL